MKTTAELYAYAPMGEKLIGTIAQVCYQSPKPVPVKKLVEAGHLSVLEHVQATFVITCSIQTLLQITRHRHLSFTVQSSRGSELKGYYETSTPYINASIQRLMEVYAYEIFEGDYPKEDLAYLLPKGAMYQLYVTGNLRAWYEYLPKRLCKRAQKEHRELAMQIKEQLAEVYPNIFADVTAPCSYCKEERCAFA